MTPDAIKLQDGTLIRHKTMGYEGRIEGTTEIKACFTVGGELLNKLDSKQTFQYRVVVNGEAMRRIAPEADLEIVEGVTLVACPACGFSFETKPGTVDKPSGRCQCGGWICPSCLHCKEVTQEPACPKQRKRLLKRLERKKSVKG
jgi:hypothetical protein